jgi:hypothetical protein
MIFGEYQPSTRPVRRCWVEAARDVPAIAPELDDTGGMKVRSGRICRSEGLRVLPWTVHQSGQKRGCGQCPHPGLRIRLYRHRTGPDWEGFLRTGGLSGEAAGSSPISGTCFPCSEAV